MSFFGATGTPVLDFWWRLLWGSKPEWVLPYSLFAEANVMYIPRDLWDTISCDIPAMLLTLSMSADFFISSMVHHAWCFMVNAVRSRKPTSPLTVVSSSIICRVRIPKHAANSSFFPYLLLFGSNEPTRHRGVKIVLPTGDCLNDSYQRNEFSPI